MSEFLQAWHVSTSEWQNCECVCVRERECVCLFLCGEASSGYDAVCMAGASTREQLPFTCGHGHRQQSYSYFIALLLHGDGDDDDDDDR